MSRLHRSPLPPGPRACLPPLPDPGPTPALIGIDLGTTHSLAAVMTAHGPALIRNALGEVLTPSIIGFDEQDRVHVGRTAQELQVTRPDRCAAVFKRHMGTDRTLKLAGKTLTPVELSSLVLRSLKQDAEASLGIPVDRAVITVPAYFNDNQRNATIEAARLIGLDVARILNEPTAAAIAYGLHESGDDKTVLVVDLGGGTFDVSIVQFFEGTLEIRASSGETFLGGEDITGVLATKVLQQRGIALERAEMESPLLVSRLRRECEIAKRQLSRQTLVVIAIPGKDGEIGDGAPQVTVTREELDEWSAPILDRIESPIRRVLGDAGLPRHDVDEVLLVGGATRMPAFVTRIRELFGQEPRCSINPDEVVAQGAAIQAGLFANHAALDDLVVTDVAPFSLGVAVCRDIGGRSMEGYFLPIIHRNTTIPVSRVETVGTRTPNQTEIRVHVYQGESRMVADNLLIGEFEVGEIPLGPPGQEIDLRITYDLNGVLEVEATIKATKKKVTHIITRHAQKLSTGQIREAVAALQALKVDPRDQAENHYLLQRAARVFRELPPEVRGLLDDWITSFEAALEKRDSTAIATTRESLREFLDRIDPRPDEWGDEPQDRGGESEDGDGRRR